MISFINNNHFTNVLLLLPYAILLRLSSILHPSMYLVSDTDTVLSRFLIGIFGSNPSLQIFVSIILCYVIAVLIAFITNKNRLFKRPNLYPAIFFIIFSSFHKECHTLSPALLSVLFIVIFIHFLMQFYRNHNDATDIFNAGLFSVLAAFTYLPLSVLSIAGIIGLAYFKTFNHKDLLKLILGIFAGLIILSTIFFATGSFSVVYFNHLGLSTLLFNQSYWTSDRLIFMFVLVLSLAVGLLSYERFLKKDHRCPKKNIFYLHYLVAFGADSYNFQKHRYSFFNHSGPAGFYFNGSIS